MTDMGVQMFGSVHFKKHDLYLQPYFYGGPIIIIIVNIKTILYTAAKNVTFFFKSDK